MRRVGTIAIVVGLFVGCGSGTAPQNGADRASSAGPDLGGGDLGQGDLAASRADAVAPDDRAQPTDAAGIPDFADAVPDARPTDAPASALDGGALDAAALHARADEALQRLLLDFWNPAKRYLNAQHPDNAKLTGYWTFAQAFDAVLDGVVRTSGQHYAGMIATLYQSQNTIGWSRDYFDDENWMALALLRAYDLTQQQAYLDQATSLYADIAANAWDTSACGQAGNFWDRAHTQKATASNAGPVITAVRLYQHTQNANYLADAKRVYDNWHSTMVDPTTHQVADHVDCSTGNIVRWKFTYNEGLMIGAAVALNSVTQDPAYLADAEDIAAFMVASETRTGADGAVLFDGDDTHCSGDCAQFKGIGFRYLASLASVDSSDPENSALLAQSARSIWEVARDPATGTFGVDWSAAFAGGAVGIEQMSSAAMALSLFAAQAGPYPGTPVAGVLEAEDGVLHGVGLEATQAGFSGWGYLAGWNADAQWVDLAATVATAGLYRLEFRYAAAAGTAKRLIYINGNNAVDAQSFPGTSAWNDYQTVEASAMLKAGANTISVIFNSSLGSTNYLNLDKLTLSQ